MRKEKISSKFFYVVTEFTRKIKYKKKEYSRDL